MSGTVKNKDTSVSASPLGSSPTVEVSLASLAASLILLNQTLGGIAATLKTLSIIGPALGALETTVADLAHSAQFSIKR